MYRYYSRRRQGLYRSRDGIVCGVCGGIAEYFDISAFWTRAIAAGFLFCTGIFPLIPVYFVAALIMKKNPYSSYEYDYDYDD